MKALLKNKNGFTLIEVMVAMVILAGAIVTLNSSWSGNYSRINKAQINHNVAELLQKKITELEVFYRNKPLAEIKESDGGAFEGYPNYRWEMESQDFEMPDLTPILVGQDGGADELMITMIRTMSEYISKSVKEVKVSVLVKYKKKEVRYAVTTFFVDYTKELSLGAFGGGGG